MAVDREVRVNDVVYPLNRMRVFEGINRERVRQGELKAAGKFLYTCADSQMLSADKYLVLGEECGEVGRAILNMHGYATDYKAGLEDVHKELIQVAAVAVAWLEFIEGVLRPDTGFQSTVRTMGTDLKNEG